MKKPPEFWPPSVQLCCKCNEALGSVLAVLALKKCPGCHEPVLPVEIRTFRADVVRRTAQKR